MANPIKGEVSLNGPGGEAFTLKYDFESLVLVEDRRDKSFGDVVEELKDGRLGALGALFWAGVHAHHPEVTFEAAGRVIMGITEGGRALELQNKIIEAINAGFPNAKGVDASAARPQAKEAGNSTSSDASALGASSN